MNSRIDQQLEHLTHVCRDRAVTAYTLEMLTKEASPYKQELTEAQLLLTLPVICRQCTNVMTLPPQNRTRIGAPVHSNWDLRPAKHCLPLLLLRSEFNGIRTFLIHSLIHCMWALGPL